MPAGNARALERDSLHQAPDEDAVKGLFDDADSAARAVERLAQEHVPTDEVRVFLVGESGSVERRIPVRNDVGARHGALIGAFIGAIVGFFALIASLAAARFGIQPLGSLSFLGGAYLIGGCAAAGAPIGAAFGMGGLWGHKRLAAQPGDAERVMVAVDTTELADVARRTLRDSGAQEISG